MSDTNAIIQVDELELDLYGGRPEIREMQTRIMAMMPSAKDLGPSGAMALAQTSLAMNLNPFTGEIWAIPQGRKNNQGTYDTYGIMVGIKGLRAKAHEQAKADGGMYTVHFRRTRDEEIEGLQINAGDIARACDLTVSGNRARLHFALTGEVPRFVGIGVYRKGESTKMSPLGVARKRAESDAIKQAFDVPLPMVPGTAIAFEDELSEQAAPNARYTDPNYYETHAVEGNADDAIADLYGDPPPENVGPPNSNGQHAEPEPVQDAQFEDEPEAEPEPHKWTADEATDLIVWTRNELVITDKQTLEALGVAKISEYTGTPEAARAHIQQYLRGVS